MDITDQPGIVYHSSFTNNFTTHNWDECIKTINQYAHHKDREHGCNAKVYLDNTYPTILPDSWIVLESERKHERSLTCESSELYEHHQQQQQPSENITNKSSNFPKNVNIYKSYKVLKTEEETVADFLLTSKVTALSLKKNYISYSDNCDFTTTFPVREDCNWGNFELRKTTVYAQSEELELSPLIPYDYALQVYQNPFKNDRKNITLDRVVDLLSKGQHILITGALNNISTDVRNEIAVIESIDLAEDKYHTIISLQNELLNDFDIRTVKINANIAYASHGDTKIEIIGSGDPSQIQQQFTLKQKPLTFFSIPNTTNSQTRPKSSLEITVDDIIWNEIQSLNGAGAHDRVYMVRIDNDGTVNIIFGNGLNGSRPPAGIENIKAKYRTGIGKEGLIKENQIKLILNKPLGVNSATNPLATSGAEEPEDIDNAKKNASNTISINKQSNFN